jgi:hypothetical protein
MKIVEQFIVGIGPKLEISKFPFALNPEDHHRAIWLRQ